MSDKTRETRLRRMAERQELKLVKSGRRDSLAVDYDRWTIVDPYNNNAVVAGTGVTGRASFTLDDVEEYLKAPRALRCLAGKEAR